MAHKITHVLRILFDFFQKQFEGKPNYTYPKKQTQYDSYRQTPIEFFPTRPSIVGGMMSIGGALIGKGIITAPAGVGIVLIVVGIATVIIASIIELLYLWKTKSEEFCNMILKNDLKKGGIWSGAWVHSS